MFSGIRIFFLAARPKTLTASIGPVLIGSALSCGAEKFSFVIFFVILFSALSIQVLTNYVNDLWDYKKGNDTSDRRGPTRFVQSGQISEHNMLMACYVASLVAFVSGLFLVYEGGLPILIIGVLSIVGAYAYTAGPYPLAHNGLGEVFVLVFFGPVAVLGTQYLLSGSISMPGFLYGLSFGCLASGLLVVNNARDIEEDRKTGKRTLAARYGIIFSRIEFFATIFLPYLFLLIAEQFWNHDGLKLVYIFFLLPFSIYLARSFGPIERPELIPFNRLLPQVGIFMFVFSIILSVEIFIG
ncbi:MAG TPA: 1,4-dihydroxy-2-naphthoate octaprenyltransferase [Oligoflexia bacterium]|nr:1,4-dihydroxy-2-naphthoate octaprenyltransferase [Oligoflexia bacterium]HMP48330.1 1,4-dihydroxy-2-naphthoate octaprenyltransferase [Oligoflexia bacterium]